MMKQSIGVFDSGYGGLTVFKSIAAQLPAYDYIYLGDNARAPYGDHSFETVYQYTLECVTWLFEQGCPLVILACNTASAKALRSIQQQVLPEKYPNNRVLGVIRPTAEVIQDYTQTNRVGVLGTRGTINSQSYQLEINKLFPDIQVYQQSCPMWVPLIENNEHLGDGADYFVREYVDALLEKSGDIDCILLACTHYPLLLPKIRKMVPEHIGLVVQGDIVAESLGHYLGNHPEIETRLSRGGKKLFYTSGDTAAFDEHGSLFFGQPIRSVKITPGCKSA